MGLSVIEIAEEDCNTQTYLETTVISDRHIKTLINKWYKEKEEDPDWVLLSNKDQISVGQKIFVRSPMFCQTPNMKICKKCWGDKNLPTTYIGILAGQILAERFTQLSLRSFHDSGSAMQDIDNVLMEFIRDHLENIKTNELAQEITLIFNTKLIPIEFTNLESYKNTSENTVVFNYTREQVTNKDPVEGLKKMKEMIKSTKNIKNTPAGYYQELMEVILDVGSPYSGFVEILFTNMFLCNNNNIWRYNQHEPIIKKLGDKTLASHINPLLNLLYQQNVKTINNIDLLDKYIINNKNMTVYEKLFLEQF